MRKVAIALVVVALFIGLKSCGEPYDSAQEVVEDFMEEIREGEGMDAVKYLHPSFRDNLTKDLRLPVQFTELRPSEALACLLSTMGASIKEVDVRSGELIGENTALIRVRVEDKNELAKLFDFVLIKEGDRWMIADIAPYVPRTLQK